jgi:hypothetical protein
MCDDQSKILTRLVFAIVAGKELEFPWVKGFWIARPLVDNHPIHQTGNERANQGGRKRT